MRYFKAGIFMSPDELDDLSRELTERSGEKTAVLPVFIDQIEEKVFYLCDGYACEGPCPDFCKHTSDIRHARNFFQKHDGTWWELKEKHRDVAKN